MTQLKQIEKHLKRYKKISTWDAINKYRITRLSHYIYLLRSQYRIESVQKSKGKKRWTDYVLKG